MGLIPWRNKHEVAIRKEPTEAWPSMGQLRQEVDRLFDNFFREPWALFGPQREKGSSWTWMPSLDVKDDEKGVTVLLEVPGIDPKDIDISVSGNMLTIQGEKKEEKEEKGKDYYHAERCFGSFRRVVELPPGTDTDSLLADYKKGVLRLTAKRTGEIKQKRIPIFDR